MNMNMKTNSDYKLNKYSNRYIEMKTKFKYTYKLTNSCQLNIYYRYLHLHMVVIMCDLFNGNIDVMTE